MTFIYSSIYGDDVNKNPHRAGRIMSPIGHLADEKLYCQAIICAIVEKVYE